jgi:Tfp pilus assembly pilus retraction ATPase PilT
VVPTLRNHEAWGSRFGVLPAVAQLGQPPNARTRECIEKGERENRKLLDAIKGGASEGMQHFDGEIAQLVKERTVDFEMGLSFATNPSVLGQELAR